MTSVNDLVAASIISAIPPTAAAFWAYREARKVHKQVRVPDRRQNHPGQPKHAKTTTGEEIADIRADVYSLGQMFGVHIIDHESAGGKPITLNDLSKPAPGAKPPERRRPRPAEPELYDQDKP